jgi:uncharacterized protein YuzB (UPF0349 family)
MSKVYKICDICNKKGIKKISDAILEMDNNAKIDIGCQNLCGLGQSKYFVIIDARPYLADTVEELIEQVKKVI